MTDYASFETCLQVRDDLSQPGDGHTVEGILVPYGVVTHGAGRTAAGSGRPYSESFRRGAFAKTITEAGSRVVLRPAHGAAPVGKAVLLEEREEGLWGRLRVSDVPAGRDMLTLIRDGVTSDLSIEFVPVRERKTSDGVIERTEVVLRGVAATAHPAYQGAAVLSVRDFDADDQDQAPRLAQIRRELIRLRLTAS